MRRVLLACFLFSCIIHGYSQKQTINDDLLFRKWKQISAQKPEDGSDRQSSGHYLSFVKEDSTFIEEYISDSIYTHGKWKLEDDSLILLYPFKPVNTLIDSGYFSVQKDNPVIRLYGQGEELARFVKGELVSDREKRVFYIEKLTSDTLSLGSKKGKLVFVYKKTVIATHEDGGFGIMSIVRGVLGLFTVLFIAFLFSANRRKISWRVVSIGLLVQLVIAILVLKVPFVQTMIEFVGQMFIKVLDFTKVGSEFLFGNLLDIESFGVIFAFQILPTILFFSALTSILFYYGVIQKIVYGLAWLMTKALKISGAESLSAAGNIFLGQTESPFLIKEYLKKMNPSEIMVVMVGGMATIAGGVLAIYIGLLGGDDPVERLLFAKHLITASVMAAPGAIVAAKILVPQTEPIESRISITKESIGDNILDAISNGTVQGIKLAVNVGAMLIVFLALIALLNFVLLKIGSWTSLNPLITEITSGRYQELSLQFILGYVFTPVAWAIGVPGKDMALVAQLFGEKIILNEMIAYVSMKELLSAGAFAYEKSIIIATYILCGFANFASVGIQIGGIGALAPGKKGVLSKLGMRALVGGALASLLSATIVGMILG
jgi:CNT family concentrative nucleoside transporter